MSVESSLSGATYNNDDASNDVHSKVTKKKPKTKEEMIKMLQEKVQRKEIRVRDKSILFLTSCRYNGGFAGHAFLEHLDLRGLDNANTEGLLYVLSRCYGLVEVKIPFGSEFDESGYERKLPRRDLRGEPFFKFAFSRLCYTESNTDFDGITLCNDRKTMCLQYRDKILNRIMLEKICASFIQRVYKIHRWYEAHRRNGLMRRIIHWLVVQRAKRKWWKEFNRFVLNQRVRCIQKYFRANFLPFSRATLLLQRMVRGWFARRLASRIKLLHSMATRIQKVMRGILVRISDRYILSQIYMKLPPFWKTVVQSSPPKLEPVKVEHQEMTQLRHLTTDMIGDIENTFKKRGKNIHGSVPKYVSQSFDKQPYVSTIDGRKISFYRHSTDGILSKPERPQIAIGFTEEEAPSVHPFNVSFWPLVTPIECSNQIVIHEDMHQNPFELQVIFLILV
jgi:hypothetical protein